MIIHPDFYRRTHSSQTFMNFLLTLIYEGLENKYPQFKLDTGKSNRILVTIFVFSFPQHIHTNKEASIPMSLKKIRIKKSKCRIDTYTCSGHHEKKREKKRNESIKIIDNIVHCIGKNATSSFACVCLHGVWI